MRSWNKMGLSLLTLLFFRNCSVNSLGSEGKDIPVKGWVQTVDCSFRTLVCFVLQTLTGCYSVMLSQSDVCSETTGTNWCLEQMTHGNTRTRTLEVLHRLLQETSGWGHWTTWNHFVFFTGLLEECSQQEVQQAFAVLDFLWTLQLQPPSLDSRHCRDTPALWFSRTSYR